MSLTIAEAAARTGLTAHTLRYYERDGLMLRDVDRSATGHRRYEDQDLQWIQLLTCLRGTGMPISDVRRYAALVRDGGGNEAEGEDRGLLHYSLPGFVLDCSRRRDPS